MDGNNRWSIKNSINKFDSYKKGAKKLIKISEHLFFYHDISYISAFALSSNNMQRSSNFLLLLKKIINDSLIEIEKKKINFNIRFIGNLEFLGKELNEKIASLPNNKSLKKNLIIFLNYGGQEDIIQAALQYKNPNKKFKSYLYTDNIPDPDLIVRTGGFARLSNFLLFQISFTELFFLKKMWPDLTNLDLNNIIKKFEKIDRKFGKQ